jgi:hypothetical protein
MVELESSKVVMGHMVPKVPRTNLLFQDIIPVVKDKRCLGRFRSFLALDQNR